MKHRILHIISDLAHGGTQRQMALVAAGLPPAEFEVRVVALGHGGAVANELLDRDINVMALGRRRTLDPGAWWNLHRLIVESRADLVHLWLSQGIGPLAAIVTTTANVPRLIVTQRSIKLSAGFVQALFGQQLAKRTRFVVASCRAVEHALGQQGWAVQKQILIPDGVPASPALACSRQQLLAALNIPENARLLLTVGPLTRAKRIKDLIWATDMLKFFRDDVHLLIAGDGPERARLERFRGQCEIEDKVHFLGDRTDVVQVLPHCDVLYSACGAESPSVAILEAMMAGVPVVAVDSPVNREMVALGETGLLVPRGDRNQFARCAHKLTTDPALRQRLAEGSRRRAIEHFGAEQMVDRYAQLYRQVLTKI